MAERIFLNEAWYNNAIVFALLWGSPKSLMILPMAHEFCSTFVQGSCIGDQSASGTKPTNPKHEPCEKITCGSLFL
jgi:hypothetical protein